MWTWWQLRLTKSSGITCARKSEVLFDARYCWFDLFSGFDSQDVTRNCGYKSRSEVGCSKNEKWCPATNCQRSGLAQSQKIALPCNFVWEQPGFYPHVWYVARCYKSPNFIFISTQHWILFEFENQTCRSDDLCNSIWRCLMTFWCTLYYCSLDDVKQPHHCFQSFLFSFQIFNSIFKSDIALSVRWHKI